MSEGVDFSGTHPTIQALKAAGKKFVVRYLPYNGNPSATKSITPAEQADYLANGIAVAYVFEVFAADAVGGAPRGAWAAELMKPALQDLAIPADRPIYIAIDFDAQREQETVIDQYLLAIDAAIPNPVGVYGGYNVVERVARSGSAKWFWQTYAWSQGLLSTKAHLYQYQNAVSLGGVEVDLNRSLKYDFGQRPKPASPTPGFGPYVATLNGRVTFFHIPGGTTIPDTTRRGYFINSPAPVYHGIPGHWAIKAGPYLGDGHWYLIAGQSGWFSIRDAAGHSVSATI